MNAVRATGAVSAALLAAGLATVYWDDARYVLRSGAVTASKAMLALSQVFTWPLR